MILLGAALIMVNLICGARKPDAGQTPGVYSDDASIISLYKIEHSKIQKAALSFSKTSNSVPVETESLAKYGQQNPAFRKLFSFYLSVDAGNVDDFVYLFNSDRKDFCNDIMRLLDGISPNECFLPSGDFNGQNEICIKAAKRSLNSIAIRGGELLTGAAFDNEFSIIRRMDNSYFANELKQGRSLVGEILTIQALKSGAIQSLTFKNTADSIRAIVQKQQQDELQANVRQILAKAEARASAYEKSVNREYMVAKLNLEIYRKGIPELRTKMYGSEGEEMIQHDLSQFEKDFSKAEDKYYALPRLSRKEYLYSAIFGLTDYSYKYKSNFPLELQGQLTDLLLNLHAELKLLQNPQ